MKRIFFMSMIIALMALGVGCQLTDSGPTTPEEPAEDPGQVTIDLDSETGGFTFSDEQPAFGEAELFEAVDIGTDYEDGTANDAEVQNMLRHRYVKLYRFRALWGRLARACNDTTDVANAECCPLDWTGRLHLQGGVIIIERTIKFDARDYITRVDRSTIDWVSHTCPHVDGIQVMLIVAPGPQDSTRPEVEPRLIFRTGPYSRSFTLDELENLNIMEPVDRCHNGISISSHIIPPACPRGYLAGLWKAIEPDLDNEPESIAAADTTTPPDTTDKRGEIHGVFRGIWIGHHGHGIGYLKGVYGVNSAGKHVFFGKLISKNGECRGIIRGEYGTYDELAVALSDPENPYGWFAGVWMNKTRAIEGRLKGRWVAAMPGFGFFHGQWGMNCAGYLE
jgi:hypothetical protein